VKVVILAGGLGTRITEDSQFIPKPMIEIGGMPILIHIMKLYSHYGFNEFVICAGYKQHIIKEYFANYFIHMSDITFDFTDGNNIIVHNQFVDPWKVTVVDTGLNTMTGGRVKRVKQYIGNEPFFLTYGDGVSDINIEEELEFHKLHGKAITMSAYNVKQRYGVIIADKNGIVSDFREKSLGDGNLINIGFMICEPRIFDWIEGDDTVLENGPLIKATQKGELMAYKHNGFWQCMDTLREKQQLEKEWNNNTAAWKVW